MKKRIYLSPPHINTAVEEQVTDVISSNWIAPIGRTLDAFESDLSAYNENVQVCAVNSGTAAIHLALDILDVQPGDWVLVQSLTQVGSVNPILYRGARPVFIDSEPHSWNMCPEALQQALQAITEQSGNNEKGRLKAIIPVHLYGNPASMQEIGALAGQYGIPVLEDAAESLGSTYRGRKTGTLGDMGIYSFNGNKIITTSGGGALVSHRADWIDRARYLAAQARDEAPHYQHRVMGYNYRLSNVLAGIGRGQMQVLPERIAQRRANFEKYQSYFQKKADCGYQVALQEEQAESFCNRWLSTVLIDPALNKGITREQMRLALREEEIEARPLWKPMHLQPLFAKERYYTREGLCPQSNVQNSVSDVLFSQGLCLPSGSQLSAADFARIFEVLEEVFKA